MSDFIKVFGGVAVGEVVVFLGAMAFLAVLLIKVKDFIVDFHDKRQEECFRLDSLMASMNEMQESFAVFVEKVNQIEHKVDLIDEESNKYRLASLRDKIFKDYQWYMSQGKVTDSQLSNFENNVREYELRGGNSAVLHKYAPEVRELPVVGDREVLR